MSAPTKEEVLASIRSLDNMTQLGPCTFLVRTQAGFKKALKTFWDDPADGPMPDVHGYPASYPAVMVLVMKYRGYHYIEPLYYPVNDLYDFLKAEHEASLAKPNIISKFKSIFP